MGVFRSRRRDTWQDSGTRYAESALRPVPVESDLNDVEFGRLGPAPGPRPEPPDPVSSGGPPRTDPDEGADAAPGTGPDVEADPDPKPDAHPAPADTAKEQAPELRGDDSSRHLVAVRDPDGLDSGDTASAALNVAASNAADSGPGGSAPAQSEPPVDRRPARRGGAWLDSGSRYAESALRPGPTGTGSPDADPLMSGFKRRRGAPDRPDPGPQGDPAGGQWSERRPAERPETWLDSGSRYADSAERRGRLRPGSGRADPTTARAGSGGAPRPASPGPGAERRGGERTDGWLDSGSRYAESAKRRPSTDTASLMQSFDRRPAPLALEAGAVRPGDAETAESGPEPPVPAAEGEADATGADLGRGGSPEPAAESEPADRAADPGPLAVVACAAADPDPPSFFDDDTLDYGGDAFRASAGWAEQILPQQSSDHHSGGTAFVSTPSGRFAFRAPDPAGPASGMDSTREFTGTSLPGSTAPRRRGADASAAKSAAKAAAKAQAKAAAKAARSSTGPTAAAVGETVPDTDSAAVTGISILDTAQAEADRQSGRERAKHKSRPVRRAVVSAVTLGAVGAVTAASAALLGLTSADHKNVEGSPQADPSVATAAAPGGLTLPVSTARPTSTVSGAPAASGSGTPDPSGTASPSVTASARPSTGSGATAADFHVSVNQRSADPDSVQILLRNSGSAPLSWSASPRESWIALSQRSGTLAAGGSVTITASATSAAPSGQWTAGVVFSPGGQVVAVHGGTAAAPPSSPPVAPPPTSTTPTAPPSSPPVSSTTTSGPSVPPSTSAAGAPPSTGASQAPPTT
jgi:Viral BACON domain